MKLQAFLMLSAALSAAHWIPIPEGGQAMLPQDSITALRFTGSSIAASEIVGVEEMPFSRAVRVNITGMPRQAWDVQILGSTTSPIRRGDILLLSLFARGTSQSESGEALCTAYLQRRGGDYAKFIGIQVSAGSQWRQFVIPARIETDLPEGQHEIAIHMAYQQQILEIGGISLVNYGPSVSLADLPRSKISYPGAEPDAPWRHEAAKRIEQLRKANLNVEVTDAAGAPVEGAEVRVEQKRHEFGFGSAVAADGIFSTRDDSHAYREVIRTWFNKVVLENDLKWPSWEGNRARALNALEWLRENGISRVRGHNLVWPSWRYMPADVEKLAGAPDKLRARVLEHIEEEVSATRGQLVEWDVINEPYTNTDLQKILGEEEMAAWFRKAREADGAPRLYINDYSILTNGGTDRAHQDHYFDTIRKLREQGAPVEGIGMQGHFGANLTSAGRVWQILDRFAVFNIPIQITEFDIDIDDEEAQAAYTRDFLTMVFAHPSVDGFMMWGFWEGRHWKPRAAMFRRDWTLKPNAHAYHDLVFGEWWTHSSGRAGADGSYAVRGFKGDYDIEVAAGGRNLRVPARLSGDGATVRVVLPSP